MSCIRPGVQFPVLERRANESDAVSVVGKIKEHILCIAHFNGLM